ncbi:unnamed protein product [Rotaria socialis]|uniref:Uncharacterized protein n=2 Tax=Rotaria socialis TaxID=392032 RepID=A0A818DVU0_9BILA|nr:unnamed protein product [Rotaria socialis]CAF4877438.1 unnamed protein product [Rotaria socialis]
MSTGQKFARLLQYLGKCSESIMYHDEIASAVRWIGQIESIMTRIHFHSNQVFDESKHVIDVVAKEYLEKAIDNVDHLIPVEVSGGGNCLHGSILLLMNNPMVTTSELRVRTIIELMTNEVYYSNRYSQLVGPLDIAIQDICKNHMFSELYEIGALCSVLGCNIRSIYPNIDFRDDMVFLNNIFTPIPPITTNCEVTILWYHAKHEKDDRDANHGTRSPNHFVPLMSTSNVMTPDKKTFKNNATVQIRIPEFQSSPSRRLPSEINIENDSAQSIISTTIQREPNDIESQHQSRIEKKRECARSSRMNETNDQRQKRLEKQKNQTQSRRAIETEKQRANRLQNNRERIRSTRANETEEQRQIRLGHQRERSQTNRTKKKLKKHASDNIAVQPQNIDMQLNETEEQAPCDDDNMTDLVQKAISRGLKETCLQQFLQQMSMSALAETTCSVCNVRTAVKKSKKIPVSKIPNAHLLKVSDELKDLIITNQSSTAQNSSGINIHTAEHDQSSSPLNSPYFYCKNRIILYVNGLSQESRVIMCTVCQKCYDSLSKKHIPKFSPANNMWLGDVPTGLQGLTIPEEKLISLYRHNSCVIKLHSPFHSTTTAQSALKGNCITFLQNIPNIVNSLPLRLDDLCETLKVIFVGARPPKRIQLEKILTVRKKKLYKHYIGLRNII